jgi:hypothetical protein
MKASGGFYNLWRLFSSSVKPLILTRKEETANEK